MNIEKIYLLDDSEFSIFFKAWAEANFNIEAQHIEHKSDLLTLCDGLVLFHALHDFQKEHIDLKENFEKHHIPTHKVDVNGTIAATISNLEMWFARNTTKSVVFIGASKIASNEHFNKFLEALAEKK